MVGDKRGTWRIGGYVADELIGYGASAQVWRGHVGRTAEPVALKVLDLADSSAVRSARSEAALLSALDHPHLVRLRELVPDGQSIVLVLELAVGGSLADLLARRGRLSPGEVVSTISPIAAALAYAHDQGVVHSDVAPANILFRGNGSPVLADLGVARLIGRFDPPRSTLAYVDPGVAAGGIPSDASDVFMVAATALHALTGAPPWPGTTAESVLAQASTGEIGGLDERLAAVPATVADVIRRGLSAAPAARGSAAEFALDLRCATAPVAVDLGAGRPPEHRAEAASGPGVGRQPWGRSRTWFGPGRTSASTCGAGTVGSGGDPVFVLVPTRSSFGPAQPRAIQPRPWPIRPKMCSWIARTSRGQIRGMEPRRMPASMPSLRYPGSEWSLMSQTPPRLALTHVVRAQVRRPEPAPTLGLWSRWRVAARPRASVALVVIALVVMGLILVVEPWWRGRGGGRPGPAVRRRLRRPVVEPPLGRLVRRLTPPAGRRGPGHRPRVRDRRNVDRPHRRRRHRRRLGRQASPRRLDRRRPSRSEVPGGPRCCLRSTVTAKPRSLRTIQRRWPRYTYPERCSVRTRRRCTRRSDRAAGCSACARDIRACECLRRRNTRSCWSPARHWTRPSCTARECAPQHLPAHRPVAMTVALVPNGSGYLISGIEVST